MILLANGLFPSHPVALQPLLQAEDIVCCDGAFQKLLDFGLTHLNTTDITIVGDGDSLPPDIKTRFSDRFIHIAEQETNDLTKAFHHCLSLGATDITILGATGLRDDHTLGNLSLLAQYSLQASVRIITDHGTFTALHTETSLPSFAGQQVSIFSLTPQVPISVSGLRYPIHHRCLDQWWHGTLNESLADTFIITPHASPASILVFQTHKQ